MGHSHTHSGNRRRLRIALGITATYTIVEALGGLLTGSLALLADAGHMLTDSMALALAVFAFAISERPPDSRRSFGYHRFQILASFVNGLTLLAIVVWIVIEALLRFLDPQPVLGGAMLAIACVGLVVNLVVFWILHGGDQHNLNMRGAALHVLADLLGSVAAIVAAVVIISTGWVAIDAILSLVVAGLILRSAWFLVKRSGHILLEGTPDSLDVDELQARIVAEIPGVSDVHHLHVWALTQEHLVLTMHVVPGAAVEDSASLLREIKGFLSEHYGVAHATIEVDVDSCADRSVEDGHAIEPH